MRTALINGAALRWQQAGEGRPLLFLHGFPFNAGQWEPQLQQLPHGWQGIAPNLRGFGGSAAPGDGPLTMEQHAADVLALLDHLSVRRAVVAGLSMGGYVALALQRLAPARVAGLVLADTRAEPDSDETRQQRMEQAASIRAAGARQVRSQLGTRLLSAETRSQRPEAAERVEQMMLETPPDTLVRGLQGLATRPDARPALDRIRVPALVIGGEADEVTPPDTLRALAAGIPGARLVLLAGAGHVSNLECPAEFDRALHSFLSELPA